MRVNGVANVGAPHAQDEQDANSPGPLVSQTKPAELTTVIILGGRRGLQGCGRGSWGVMFVPHLRAAYGAPWLVQIHALPSHQSFSQTRAARSCGGGEGSEFIASITHKDLGSLQGGRSGAGSGTGGQTLVGKTEASLPLGQSVGGGLESRREESFKGILLVAATATPLQSLSMTVTKGRLSSSCVCLWPAPLTREARMQRG